MNNRTNKKMDELNNSDELFDKILSSIDEIDKEKTELNKERANINIDDFINEVEMVETDIEKDDAFNNLKEKEISELPTISLEMKAQEESSESKNQEESSESKELEESSKSKLKAQEESFESEPKELAESSRIALETKDDIIFKDGEIVINKEPALKEILEEKESLALNKEGETVKLNIDTLNKNLKDSINKKEAKVINLEEVSKENKLDFSNNTKTKDLPIMEISNNQDMEIPGTEKKDVSDSLNSNTSSKIPTIINQESVSPVESQDTNQELEHSSDTSTSSSTDSPSLTSIETEEMKNTNTSKKSSLKLIMIILVILIIGLLGAFGYQYIVKEKPKENNTTPEAEPEIKEETYLNYTYTMCQMDTELFFSLENLKCKEDYFQIKTKTNKAEALYFDNENLFLLLEDDGKYIYNLKTEQREKVSLTGDFIKEEFAFNINRDKNKVVGIIYKENGKTFKGYYNILEDKKMFEDKYDDIFTTNSDKYLTANGNGDPYLLNISKNEVEFSGDFYYSIYSYQDKDLILVEHDIDGQSKTIYNSNKEKIVDVTNNYQGNCYDIYNGYLYAWNNNQVKKYDLDGKIVAGKDFSLKQFKNIVNNKVIYVDDDNYLSIYDFDTKKNAQIVKLEDNYNYDSVSYYSKEDLVGYNETKDAGIYISLYYEDGIDKNGYYGIEYCYTDSETIKSYPILHEMGGRAKPVLYLYPNEKTKVTVTFQHPEYLTTTYPKYDGKWEVIAKPNGDLTDKNNKYYYALYWDETRYHEVNFEEGFYVAKENAIDFLEEKLTTIGLNPKERNEFIMYWLPILEKNNKSLVYFELTEEREHYNKINISPKPDSLLRVAIHIKKVDKKTNIKEQKLKTFQRKGFVAVEWGGMTY